MSLENTKRVVGVMIFASAVMACSGQSGNELFGGNSGKDASGGDADGHGDTDGDGSFDAGFERDGTVQVEGGASDASHGEDAAASVAEPCPGEALQVDCSNQCSDGGAVSCDEVACSRFDVRAGDPSIAVIDVPARVVLRTPDHPGKSDDCAIACGNWPSRKVRAFGMGFKTALHGADGVRVRVEPPWWIGDILGLSSLYCPDDSQMDKGQGCYAQRQERTFLIWTDDPNAPARNITIEPIERGQGCN
jgi:hypothetical protein